MTDMFDAIICEQTGNRARFVSLHSLLNSYCTCISHQLSVSSERILYSGMAGAGTIDLFLLV